jgi:starch-binding outer membrane protein, SusD/RagB family
MNYAYKFFLSAFLLLTMFSCKKLTEIQETDFLDASKALKTVENNESAIIGAYAGMQIEMGILMNGELSDELKTSGEFYNSITTHEWQYGAADIVIRDNYTAIGSYYPIIDRVNRVIAALPAADSTRQGDNALKVKLKAEALFIRAFCHFELFRYYGGNYEPDGLAMPYVVTPSLGPIAREKMTSFFQKLEADINEAKPLLPNNLTDINRATRLAVSGLQARIALYKKDWQNAITYSTEYISAIPLSPRASFTGIWTDANTNELAFRLKRSPTNNPYNKMGSLYRNTSANATTIGTVFWIPSSKLWDSYDQANDIRFSTYMKTEPLLTAANRQSRLITKYAGTAYGTAGENVADAKVFRTAEMYLIRAEARAESGNFTGANSAESDINDLRAARINNYVPVTFTSKTEAIDAIILERFKELAFEGHRFWDLKRRGLAVQRIGTDAPTSTGATLPAGNFRFVIPIPEIEMQANNLMIQNPGY